MKIDALAFGPHPDDVELAMGGTLLKFASQGYRTGIIDLTDGEMGTRGTVSGRAEEAKQAAKILRVSMRRSLGLGDGRLDLQRDKKLAVASVIRELKPQLVFTNYPDNNHPDHTASGELVAEAAYLAGLKKLEIEGQPHRPHRVLYYFVPHQVTPSFVVDTTDFFEEKMRAVRAHRSQFHDGGSDEMETPVSRPGFLNRIEGIDRYFGALIDVDFGEAFYLKEAIKLDDPFAIFDQPFTRIR